MGNAASVSSYLAGTKFMEERLIRRFETTDLINQDNSEYLKKFSWISPMICFDSDEASADSAIEAVFKENFNVRVLRFIQNGSYFKKEVEGKSVYDLKKIRILIFLLTTNNNEVNYSDKGSFLFSLVRDDQNDIMEESIKSDCRELSSIINIMFEISCLEIYRFYLDEMQINLTNQLVKMQGVRERFVQDIYRQLFGYDDKTKSNFQAVDPHNVLNLFKNNKFFLTSGFIREIAFNCQADQGLVERPKKCCVIF